MRLPKTNKHPRRIASQLILLTILFSTLITLVTSILQLYGEYRRDLSDIDSVFSQINQVNLKTLSHTLWVADKQELTIQISGIFRLPNMQYIEVRDEERIWASLGSNSSNNTLSRTYEMKHTYRGKEYSIGKLTVVATLDHIYSHLLSQAVVILVSNGIKTFLVAGFIVFLFQNLITRHLVKIAEYAGNFDMSAPDNELKLDRKEQSNQEPDELEILVSAINQMQTNLRKSFEALRENEQQLRHQQVHLEELVEERTARLEAAQENLVKSERLAALGQLTATVSHELRNPLNAIQPSLYIIRTRTNSDETKIRDSVDRIERNLMRCDRIIDELLDFTRITSLELEECDLDSWIQRVVSEIDIDPQVKVNWSLGLTGVVYKLDSERMRRAVTNVVINATQAMLYSENPENTDIPKILTIQTLSSKDRYEIRISDTGSGISVENQEKVFEPLFSTKNFGVGLGMPIVRQILQLHRGGIEVESEVGKGTTICLWIPKNAGT